MWCSPIKISVDRSIVGVSYIEGQVHVSRFCLRLSLIIDSQALRTIVLTANLQAHLHIDEGNGYVNACIWRS